jgi:hypothetical protein
MPQDVWGGMVGVGQCWILLAEALSDRLYYWLHVRFKLVLHSTVACVRETVMAIIEQVREGMHVVASDGKKIGKVEDLKMGDPEAVTSDGQTDPDTGGLVNTVIDGFAVTSKLPRHDAERLLRMGYVKVDRSGLLAGHAYFASDELDRVEGDTVWLKEGQHQD